MSPSGTDAGDDARTGTAARPVPGIVRSLLEEHVTLTLADLADEVAVRTHRRPVPEIPATAVLDCYLDLYRTHVPALVDRGKLTYEPEPDRVSLAGYGTAETALDESHVVSYCDRGP